MRRPKAFKLTGEVTDTLKAIKMKPTEFIEMLEQSAPFKGSPAGWNRQFEGMLFHVGDDGTVFDFFRGPKKGTSPERKGDRALFVRALEELESFETYAYEVYNSEAFATYEKIVSDLRKRLE